MSSQNFLHRRRDSEILSSSIPNTSDENNERGVLATKHDVIDDKQRIINCAYYSGNPQRLSFVVLLLRLHSPLKPDFATTTPRTLTLTTIAPHLLHHHLTKVFLKTKIYALIVVTTSRTEIDASSRLILLLHFNTNSATATDVGHL